MVERKERKKNKLRGQRTFGHGDTKNRRGAGSRGGRGRAGSKTHKYVKYLLEGTLGEKKMLKPKKEERTLTLAILSEKFNEFLQKGLIEKQEDAFVIDGEKLGFDKLLGTGTLNKMLIVRNVKVSKKAVEKILKAKGIIETVKAKGTAKTIEGTEEEEEEFEVAEVIEENSAEGEEETVEEGEGF